MRYLTKIKTIKSRKSYRCWFCGACIPIKSSYHTYSLIGVSVNYAWYGILSKKVCLSCDARGLSDAKEVRRYVRKLNDTGLSVRTINLLNTHHITTRAAVASLLRCAPQRLPFGIGRKTIREIKDAMERQ